MDLGCWAFMAGLLATVFLKKFASTAPYPIKDPRLIEAMGISHPVPTQISGGELDEADEHAAMARQTRRRTNSMSSETVQPRSRWAYALAIVGTFLIVAALVSVDATLFPAGRRSMQSVLLSAPKLWRICARRKPRR